MVRRIRPDWSKEDIILQRFTVPDPINRSILYGGYTTSKSEMVLIKVYDPDDVHQKRLVRENSGDVCKIEIFYFCLRPKAGGPSNYLSCCSGQVVNLLLGCTSEEHFWFKPGRRPKASPGLVYVPVCLLRFCNRLV